MGVFIAPAIYRSLNVRTAASLQAAFSAPPPGEQIIFEPLWGDALIARARSVQATRWLQKYRDADVMVMIDDDIVFHADDLWKIIAGARKTRAIYAGAYVTHGDKPHLTCRELPGQPAVTIAAGLRPDPVEVEYTATGFMAVHRDVIEAIVAGSYEDADGKHRLHLCQRGAHDEEMIPFFDTMTVEEAPGVFHWLSEDWAFCERARQLHVGCFIDQSIVLEHMGEHAQSVVDMQGPGIGSDKVTIEVPLSGDALIDNIPDDLAEFTGQPLEAVYGAMHEGAACVAQLWAKWSGDETEFYRNAQAGTAYALDLGWWHMHGGGAPLQYAERLKGMRVLDYGAGIGTFALAAARAGAEVAVNEINPWLTDFVHWRAKKHGVRLDPWLPLTDGFDVIVCWHVFEHVADPEALLARLMIYLKPGGRLITQSDFHRDDGHPMHHEHPDWEAALQSLVEPTDEPFIYRKAAEARV